MWCGVSGERGERSCEASGGGQAADRSVTCIDRSTQLSATYSDVELMISFNALLSASCSSVVLCCSLPS